MSKYEISRDLQEIKYEIRDVKRLLEGHDLPGAGVEPVPAPAPAPVQAPAATFTSIKISPKAYRDGNRICIDTHVSGDVFGIDFAFDLPKVCLGSDGVCASNGIGGNPRVELTACWQGAVINVTAEARYKDPLGAAHRVKGTVTIPVPA